MSTTIRYTNRPKYDVIIKRIDPKRHYRLRYEVTVYWDKNKQSADVNCTYSLRGARRVARKLIEKHELPKEKVEIVEEYQL